jgi:hypothetical protein
MNIKTFLYSIKLNAKYLFPVTYNIRIIKKMPFKLFPDIKFPGHQGYDDYAYCKFPENQLDSVLKIVEWLGWRYTDNGIRDEYNGSHVIMIDTDEILEEIPGYRSEKRMIEHIIFRRKTDDNKETDKTDDNSEIYVTLSSRGLVSRFTEPNMKKFVNIMKINDVDITLAE